MLRNPKKTILAVVVSILAVAASSPSTLAVVLGDDGRRALGPDDAHRYSPVGLVVVANGRGVFGGTGTLINDRLTVLTAFHNVFHDGATGPIGQVKASMRGMQFAIGEGSDLTYYQVRRIRPFNRDYGLVLADENDLAVLTLQQPVEGVEPLNLRPLAPDNDGQALESVTLVAYNGYEKTVQQCRFREKYASYPRSADVLIHDCDSEGVASGAPLLDADNRIVALHLGGSPRASKRPGQPFNPRSNFNVARRMTSEVSDFVGGAGQTR